MQKVVSTTRLFPVQKTPTRQRTKSSSTYISRQDINQITEQIQPIKTIQKIVQIPKQTQVLRQTQRTLNIPKQTYARPYSVSRITRNVTPKKPLPFSFKPKPAREPKQRRGGFSVFGRRFGVFKEVGRGRTPFEAVEIGKGWARRTLGATFKVPSFKGLKVEGFKTKKTKEGIVFIEPKKKRLKRGTKEIPEIQYWRDVKSPIKKSPYSTEVLGFIKKKRKKK